MPHLVISYAKQLDKEIDIPKFSKELWQVAADSGLFDTSAIKARAFPVEHYVTGGTDQTFIHVDVKMFAGRTDEQKSTLVKDMFDFICETAGPTVSVSVEAIDIQKAGYIKT